jgi:predicted site-specific integrase-resolvase
MTGTLMLTDIPKALKELTGHGTTYQRVYRYVLDGTIPAEKNRAGRWFIKRSDLPDIAKTLGLNEGVN